MSSRRVRTVVAVAAVVVVCSVYLKWQLTPRANGDSLQTAEPFEQLCSQLGRRHFPAAAAYVGKGPHPVILISPEGPPVVEVQTSAGKIPPEAWRPKPTDAQLVVCIRSIDRVSEPDKSQICKYEGGYDLPVVKTTRAATVFEAHTGKELGEVTIPSDPLQPCPDATTVLLDSDSNDVSAIPHYEQYTKALKTYVGG